MNSPAVQPVGNGLHGNVTPKGADRGIVFIAAFNSIRGWFVIGNITPGSRVPRHPGLPFPHTCSTATTRSTSSSVVWPESARFRPFCHMVNMPCCTATC